jgi:succinate dehydrogenase / fumarate reductase membrane anchor subunit
MSMKWDDTGYKNPLARARGLGAAGGAVENWIKLRVTAVANAILAIWFIYFLHKAVGVGHAEFVALLSQPLHAIAMILFILSVFTHAALGCREIVEDYFHHEGLKIAKLIGIYLFFFAAGTACVFSVLKIAL